MKKNFYLFIFIILFIPTFVFAKSDVEIKSIERIDITSGVNEISDPSFKDLDVEFKLQFLTQGDFVKYNITLVNNSSKDYQISDDVANFKVSDYIDYSFNFDNNSGVVKANSEKVITVTISYKKSVEENNLTNGRFIEDNSLSIKLANGNINNPNTGRTILFVFMGLFVGGVLFFIFRDRSNILLPIIILVLFIPVITYALDIIQINIDSHVEVDGSCPYRIVTDRGSFVEGQDVKEICVNLVFDNEKYNFTHIPDSNNSSEKTDEYKYAFFYFNYERLGDNSFIRVYDKNTNQLVREFKKSDIPTTPRYSIDSASLLIDSIFFNYYYYIEDVDDIRFEFSDDIASNYQYDSYISYYTSVVNYELKAPWIDDSDTIEKIFSLDSSVLDYDIVGYDVKDNGHIYHVKWENSNSNLT